MDAVALSAVAIAAMVGFYLSRGDTAFFFGFFAFIAIMGACAA